MNANYNIERFIVSVFPKIIGDSDSCRICYCSILIIVICYEKPDLIGINGCSHRFCKSCLKKILDQVLLQYQL